MINHWIQRGFEDFAQVLDKLEGLEPQNSLKGSQLKLRVIFPSIPHNIKR